MIEAKTLLGYMLLLGMDTALPGPGMMTVALRSIATGPRAGLAVLFGIILGDLALLSAVVLGLAGLIQSIDGLLDGLRWCALSYLCFLAWRYWTANAIASAADTGHRSDLAGVGTGWMLTFGNPKALGFYLAIFPLAIDLTRIRVDSLVLQLLPATAVVLAVLGAVYIFAASRIRLRYADIRAQRTFSRIVAVLLLLVVIWLAVAR